LRLYYFVINLVDFSLSLKNSGKGIPPEKTVVLVKLPLFLRKIGSFTTPY